jgi:opacity protein-like surface antigen
LGANSDDTVFAYQVGVGMSFDISEKTSLDLRYRYLGASDPEYDGMELEYSGHSIICGLRFYF